MQTSGLRASRGNFQKSDGDKAAPALIFEWLSCHGTVKRFAKRLIAAFTTKLVVLGDLGLLTLAVCALQVHAYPHA
jgi:hypothetical protein